MAGSGFGRVEDGRNKLNHKYVVLIYRMINQNTVPQIKVYSIFVRFKLSEFLEPQEYLSCLDVLKDLSGHR